MGNKRVGRDLMSTSGPLCIYWPDDAESQDALKKLDALGAKDSRSRSFMMVQTVKEYVKNHGEGNPQTDMRYFTGDVEPVPAVKAKLEDKKLIVVADPIVTGGKCPACGKFTPYGLENHYEKGNNPECRPVVSNLMTKEG